MHDAVEKAKMFLDDACVETDWKKYPKWPQMISSLRESLNDQFLRRNHRDIAAYLETKTDEYVPKCDFDEVVRFLERGTTAPTIPPTPVGQQENLDEFVCSGGDTLPTGSPLDNVSVATMSSLGDALSQVCKVWCFQKSYWQGLTCTQNVSYNNWIRYDRALKLQLAIFDVNESDRSSIARDRLYAESVRGKCVVYWVPEYCPWSLHTEVFVTECPVAPEMCVGDSVVKKVDSLRKSFKNSRAHASYYRRRMEHEFSPNYQSVPVERRITLPNPVHGPPSYPSPERPAGSFATDMVRRRSVQYFREDSFGNGDRTILDLTRRAKHLFPFFGPCLVMCIYQFCIQ
ncbi:uncharacterized protein Z518_06882 [Rhinocladiella mackenziei CBS 650.93]|uniref:Uncharacterized protein n=1 Tax=Rhinocladiella mackenziei CBS 650.93 TaxID=1442369 RepID=A0A0D2J2X2_9EURO|nr:uncharacterized protein Z518_06882 [Rhinocladiella mackenziei CBS 650.93]KIX03330.1 hypothetical protein Z518_06882 [Rhinocladiella mackenziei CBS 650.93]